MSEQKIKNELGRLANALEGSALADILRDIRDGIKISKDEIEKIAKEINSKPVAFIKTKGGFIASINCNVPLDYFIADYDIHSEDTIGCIKNIDGEDASVLTGQAEVNEKKLCVFLKQLI